MAPAGGRDATRISDDEEPSPSRLARGQVSSHHSERLDLTWPDHQIVCTMARLACSVLGLCAAVGALRPAPKVPAPTVSRRDAAAAVAAAVVAVAPLSPLLGMANAAQIGACPANVQNCWSTVSTDKTKMPAWAPPAGADAAKDLKAVVDEYPQAGQAGVDLGGWSYATDELLSSGYARVEYKSGIGNLQRPPTRLCLFFVRTNRASVRRQLRQVPQRRQALHRRPRDPGPERRRRRQERVPHRRFRPRRQRQAPQLHRVQAPREGLDGAGRRQVNAPK